MTEAKLLQCYNKGCTKKFDPATNSEKSCRFHPGIPVFHDAMKGWSCCNKKSTDFSVFLSIPGCTVSLHSDVKPPEPEKPKPDPNKDELIQYKSPTEIKPITPIVRPDGDEPLVILKSTVAASLTAALEKLKLAATETATEGQAEQKDVPIGTTCKNSSCKNTYEGAYSNHESCQYHSGVPIFHEGMKFWSCCVRRTSDFDDFLAQEGCTEGSHLWFKKAESEVATCRYDWHQTGPFVFVTIYAKNAWPEECQVKANRVQLDVSTVFDSPRKKFHLPCELFGIIDPAQSVVTYFGTKIEIKMKKGEPMSWSRLTIEKKIEEPAEDADN